MVNTTKIQNVMTTAKDIRREGRDLTRKTFKSTKARRNLRRHASKYFWWRRERLWKKSSGICEGDTIWRWKRSDSTVSMIRSKWKSQLHESDAVHFRFWTFQTTLKVDESLITTTLVGRMTKFIFKIWNSSGNDSWRAIRWKQSSWRIVRDDVVARNEMQLFTDVTSEENNDSRLRSKWN